MVNTVSRTNKKRGLLLIHTALFALITAFILVAQFVAFSWLFWGAAVLALLGAVYSLVALKRGAGKETAAPEEGQSAGGAEDEARELRRRVGELEEELSGVRRENERRRQEVSNFAKQCVLVNEGTEAESRLSQVIIDKTEKATLELTDHVYTIGESSKRVGQLNNEVLGQLTHGEGGLGDDVEQIERELQTIQTLIHDFAAIRDGYNREFDEVKKTLGSVDTFTGTISDLAERTNILAINASIEAARAGSAGAGFAVIASEVQQLARNTQEIAAEINRSIDEAVEAVSGAAEKYGSQIQDAVGRLEKTGDNHSRLIERLTPQVEKLSEITRESQELSETVTENLNEVTVHLQYQDTVRQILEHMVTLFERLSTRGKDIAAQSDIDETAEKEEMREEVRTILKQLFSTREEWNAFGYALEETLEDASGNDKSESLEGDITLF
jgi:methyl-accepting chemotaxis protein